MPTLAFSNSFQRSGRRPAIWGTSILGSYLKSNHRDCHLQNGPAESRSKAAWATQYKRAPLSRYAGCVFAKKPTASRKGDTLMKSTIQYVGMDVHQSTISVAVLDAEGKRVMQSILATHAAAILDFIHGVRGTLQV